jgi:hypothetical protein
VRGESDAEAAADQRQLGVDRGGGVTDAGAEPGGAASGDELVVVGGRYFAGKPHPGVVGKLGQVDWADCGCGGGETVCGRDDGDEVVAAQRVAAQPGVDARLSDHGDVDSLVEDGAGPVLGVDLADPQLDAGPLVPEGA